MSKCCFDQAASKVSSFVVKCREMSLSPKTGLLWIYQPLPIMIRLRKWTLRLCQSISAFYQFILRQYRLTLPWYHLTQRVKWIAMTIVWMIFCLANWYCGFDNSHLKIIIETIVISFDINHTIINNMCPLIQIRLIIIQITQPAGNTIHLTINIMLIEINFPHSANDFTISQSNHLYHNPAFLFSHLILTSIILYYSNSIQCNLTANWYLTSENWHWPSVNWSRLPLINSTPT
jgi:hypothetical protein